MLDYDDLLLFWRGLLADPVAGDLRAPSASTTCWSTNTRTPTPCRPTSSSLLRPGGAGVTCVGDDAQAIYGFRAATVRNILDFEQRFPGAQVLHAHAELPLHGAHPGRHQRRHRRGRRAPRQSSSGPARTDGGRPLLVTCRDEDEQTRWLCEQHPRPPRAGHGAHTPGGAVPRPAPLHGARDRAFPAQHPLRKYGGLRFVEMAHVKDLVAFLRLAENPRDAMAAPARAGPGARHRTQDGDARCWRRSRPAAATSPSWAAVKVPEPAKRGCGPAVVALLTGLSAAEPGDVPAQVHAVRTVYGPLLERATTTRRRACATWSRSRRWPRAPPTAPSSSPTSCSTRRPTRRTRPARRCWTRTTSSSAPCTRPRAWSSTSSTSSTPPTATSRPTWRPAAPTRSKRSAACSTWPARAPATQLYVTHPLRYYTQPWAKADTHGLRAAHALREPRRARALRAGAGRTARAGGRERRGRAARPRPSAPACASSGITRRGGSTCGAVKQHRTLPPQAG